ncbi:MAG: DUF1566 domain-containing protein [bacterium]|nr:DUF1566 domain-containing protein [bacterium]
MKLTVFISMLLILLMSAAPAAAEEQKGTKKYTYTVVDTGQDRCFNNKQEIKYPTRADSFYGQDAQYEVNPPSYCDNGDGTITDLNTGLIWQKTPDFVKRTLTESKKYADALTLAGKNDWRLPTIKELFSIADFKGNMHTKTPYIDTRYFDYKYPNTDEGWRIIDAQYRSCSQYKGLTMRGQRSVFGFNFADGRIKSYPDGTRGAGRQFVRCVRGNAYGENKFADNDDGTITDLATGLTWMKADSGKKMTWEQALKYAENVEVAGKSDWRLPNVKELQSIVDYSRAPDARDKKSRAAAIDPVFRLTEMESWHWSSTTHIETRGGYYVCFGQGLSAWVYQGRKMNAHGAGAVRSDPKNGDPAQYPQGKGPQGDEIRIYNYVRCVRGGEVKQKATGPDLDPKIMGTRERSGNRRAGNSTGGRSNMGKRTGGNGSGDMSNIGNRNSGNRFGNNRNSGNSSNEMSTSGNTGNRMGNLRKVGTRSEGKSSGSGDKSHAKQFIKRLDKNGDGKVAKSEFDGPPHHFAHFDKNKDGFIIESEAPTRPPPRRRGRGNQRQRNR